MTYELRTIYDCCDVLDCNEEDVELDVLSWNPDDETLVLSSNAGFESTDIKWGRFVDVEHGGACRDELFVIDDLVLWGEYSDKETITEIDRILYQMKKDGATVEEILDYLNL